MLRSTKCWPFSVSRPAAWSIFIPGHRGLKCCINGGCAVQHYESTGQYIQVFSPPSPSSRGGSSIGAELSLFCPLLSEPSDMSASDSARSQAYITLFRFHCLIVSLLLAEETSPLGREPESECSHFEEWLPVSGGSALAIQRGDTGRLKAFPPCYPVGQQLFNLVSTYHVKPRPHEGDSTASIAQLG